MTYRETCEYLFTRTPQFERTGASAYKPGLGTTLALAEHLGNPQQKYQTIHVGGTNGKGSTSHTLAAILQSAGYKVGLFTSPHLVDFRERIRVNGEMCSEDFVVRFVEKHRSYFEPLTPSFFELTTVMALEYFAEQKVDFAVVEVGLGGRLDSTNIITPCISVVTNISLDHTDLLGNTLEEIAEEKAGIIKPSIPCILGEAHPSTLPVFQRKATELQAPLILAENNSSPLPDCALTGSYQQRNLRTAITAITTLTTNGNISVTETQIAEGVKYVQRLTGLRGRWEIISEKPLVICDVGHNPGAWEYLAPRLKSLSSGHSLHVVFGMCSDKDTDTVVNMLPTNATYYWTQAGTHRALPAQALCEKAQALNLKGTPYETVKQAYIAALQNAQPEDTIFIGGSCYIVADLLSNIQ